MSRNTFVAAPQTPKKARGFSFPPSQKQVVVVDEQKPFQAPRKIKEDSIVEDDDDPLYCDEELDHEELEKVTQKKESSLSSTEESVNAEDEFRQHVREVITEHGLEAVRGWFQLESLRFKKPKKEKK